MVAIFKLIKYITKVLFVSIFCINQIYAWNALGHRLIVQIAVDNLRPTIVKKLEQLNHNALINTAPWLDSLRYLHKNNLQELHYIDLPFTEDNTQLVKPQINNAVTAINQSTAILSNLAMNNAKRRFALRVLIHVVGDLHQPLHAISRFSKRYPNGDHGGNLVLIMTNKMGDNLHRYWDNGGGFLLSKHKVANAELRKMAHKLESKYPCYKIDRSYSQNIVMTWALESFRLARDKAYKVSYGLYPNPKYQSMIKNITQQRLAIAGCRLAWLLNMK